MSSELLRSLPDVFCRVIGWTDRREYLLDFSIPLFWLETNKFADARIGF